MTTTTHQLTDGRTLTIQQDHDDPELVVYRLDGQTLTAAEPHKMPWRMTASEDRPQARTPRRGTHRP